MTQSPKYSDRGQSLVGPRAVQTPSQTMSSHERARTARISRFRRLSLPQTGLRTYSNEGLDSSQRPGQPRPRSLSQVERTEQAEPADTTFWRPRRTSSTYSDHLAMIVNDIHAPISEPDTAPPLHSPPTPPYGGTASENLEFDQVEGSRRDFFPVSGDNEDRIQPNPVPDTANETHSLQVEHFAKQLRRLRKMTDNVLLKRTQLRHQQQKLEDCRDYLYKSTMAIRSNLQNQKSALEFAAVGLQDASQKKRRRRKKTEQRGEQLRDDKSGDPSNPSSTRVDSGVASGEGDESVDQRTDARPQGDLHLPQNILALFAQYDQDYHALWHQEDTVTQQMDELSNLEYHLQNKQKTVQQTMKSPTFAAHLRAEMLEPSLATSELSSRPKSRSNTPSLVAEYFDKAGDVGIQRERLEELDFSHMEGLQERDFVKERGDQLEVSDEQFVENYNARREEIQQDLEVAQAEAERLRARCTREGLDIKIHRTAAAPSGVSSSPPASELPDTNLMSSVPRVHELGLPSISFVDPATSSRRIKGWLRDVTAHGGDTGDGHFVAPPLESAVSSEPEASLENMQQQFEQASFSYPDEAIADP